MLVGVTSVSESVIVACTSRRVQPLNLWLTDLIQRCASVEVPLQLESAPGTVLTAPAWSAMCDAGRWVVRDGGTGTVDAWDGTNGERLTWNHDTQMWVGTGVTAPSWGALAGRLGATAVESTNSVQVLVSLALQHKPDPGLQIGQAVEFLTMALTGQEMSGWGTCEPVNEAWDTTTLTTRVRRRMPEPTRVIAVAGSHAIATIEVARTSLGVSETVTFTACPGSDTDDVGVVRVRDRVFTALTELAGRLPLAFALAHTKTGRADLMRPAHIEQAPEPAAVYLGPRAVRALGADLLTQAPVTAPVTVGNPRAPGLAFRLGASPGNTTTADTTTTGWADFATIVEHLGMERIHAAAPELATSTPARPVHGTVPHGA